MSASPEARPTLFWFRRDLRLADNPGLTAAAGAGPVIPVFILDPETETLGAAAKWRLGLSIAALDASLRDAGSRLILRRGPAVEVLRTLTEETGAGSVHWSRLYAPDWMDRDRAVKSDLRHRDIRAESFPGFLLHEPWTVKTQTDGAFKVYTPFWKRVSAMDPADPTPAPKLHPPRDWPASDDLAAWDMGRAMNRGAAIVEPHLHVGEKAALARLDDFLDGPIKDYAANRDRPDLPATSGLSENLTYGEIAPHRIWHASHRAEGCQKFLQELVWREFAWHLVWHTPHILTSNWRADWDAFPWRSDNPDAERWRRAMTGEPMIDAGMRELFVTGRMHNRVRMLVASYLVKHLLIHWSVGQAWFDDCLIDWDPASNALGWQWVAGSGPDAAPYFRIFNPATQAEKFDPRGKYRDRFLNCADYFEAVPRSWNLKPGAEPAPLIDLAEGRNRALDAYDRMRGGEKS